MSSELENLIDGKLKDFDFVNKGDMNSMLESTRDLTIRQVLDHKDCGKEGCGVCSMKGNIDQSAFKRGVINGIKIKTQYPKYNFNLGD